jgi:hypothetical protein
LAHRLPTTVVPRLAAVIPPWMGLWVFGISHRPVDGRLGGRGASGGGLVFCGEPGVPQAEPLMRGGVRDLCQ